MGQHSPDPLPDRRRSIRQADPPPRITIGAFAREFEVSLRTLRFYEDRGLLEPQRDGSTRYYSVRDRQRLRAILRLKHLGFTLTEIREMMNEGGDTGDAPIIKLRPVQVQAQIAHLERQRHEIDLAIAALRDVERGAAPL